MSQKSTLFRCTFSGVILMGEKPTPFQCTFFKVILTHFSMYYFDAILIKSLFWWIDNWHNFDILNLTFILAWKSLEEAFVSIKMQTYKKISVKVSFFNSFKKMSFVSMLSFKFSSNFCWLSSVSLKSESCSFQRCWRSCRTLDFSVFPDSLVTKW